MSDLINHWIDTINTQITDISTSFNQYTASIKQSTLLDGVINISTNSILDDEDNPIQEITHTLETVSSQLNSIKNNIPITTTTPPDSTNQQPITTPTQQPDPLTQLFGTLKKIIPAKSAVAMWFHTEMMTDLESIYHSSNIGPQVWESELSSLKIDY